jgi:hypothetical protein
MLPVMIQLNDAQLKLVMAAAAHVPAAKLTQFLERVSAIYRCAAAGTLATTTSPALQRWR